MPKLSETNINMFCRTAKVVFPVDKIFNPVDYYEAFILSSRARSVSFPTFRRYVNDLYLSGKFSGLERVRNNTRSPYMFFVDSSASSGSSRGTSFSPRKDNLSDVVLRQSAPPSYLEEFSGRLITLLTPGKKYRARSLYTKYRSEFSARIKFNTFKKYVSSAVKAGFLLNFCRITDRRRGSSGGIFYETTSAFRGKNTPVEAVAPLKKSTELTTGVPRTQACTSCEGKSPEPARFCMHCGHGLTAVFRAVVQESVRHLYPASSMSLDAVQEYAVQYFKDRLIVSWAVDDAAVGGRVALVSFTEGKVNG